MSKVGAMRECVLSFVVLASFSAALDAGQFVSGTEQSATQVVVGEFQGCAYKTRFDILNNANRVCQVWGTVHRGGNRGLGFPLRANGQPLVNDGFFFNVAGFGSQSVELDLPERVAGLFVGGTVMWTEKDCAAHVKIGGGYSIRGCSNGVNDNFSFPLRHPLAEGSCAGVSD